MIKRKNEAMYSMFGRNSGHKCAECSNLIKYEI